MKRREVSVFDAGGLPVPKEKVMGSGRRLLLTAFLLLSCMAGFAQLSGTKTINPSGSGSNNYTTFTAAVADLVAKGVNGPVVFNVSNGTYTEQITIPAITGSSAVNTITFQSLNNDSSLVNLQFTTTSAANYVVQLQNADYIIFRKMGIFSGSTTNANATVFLLAPTSTAEDCQGIEIRNCRIASYWGTSFQGGVVRVSAAKTTGFKLKNNSIYNSYGVYIQGQSTVASYTTGIELDSNTFWNTTNPANSNAQEVFEPYYIQYTTGLKMRNNKFTKTGCCADDLIQMYNCDAFEISGNRSDMSGGQYCVTMSACNTSTTVFSTVYNNYFHFSYSGGTLMRAISGSRYIKMYHNNLLHDATGGSNIGIYVDNNTSASNIQIANNIVQVNVGIPLQIDRTASVNELDNNNYYAPTGTIANIVSTAYSSISTLTNKVYTGSDANSITKDPQYTATTNLDPKAGCMVGKNEGIAADIYGVARPNPPTIGAKEITVTTNNEIALEDYVSPSGTFSPGAQDLVVKVKNYGANTVNTYDVSYILNSGSPVTINVSTPLAKCATANITFTGSNQPNMGNANFFTAYTANPNGTTDANKTNDTLRKGYCTPISGNYTIDPSGSGPTNFKTFKDAVDLITCAGISGTVNVTVAAGTYNEQVTLLPITGTSSTSQINFIGASKSTVILTYAATNTTNPHTIQYNTASWINFRDMTIRATGTTAGWVVHMLNASNNRIANCVIELTGTGTTSTSTAFMGVIMNGSNSTGSYSSAGNHTNNTVDSCDINYGYYGIYSSNGLGTRVMYFNRNNITNAYSAGGYFNSSQAIKFFWNNINMRTSANNDGLVLFNCNANSPAYHEIKYNKIRNAGTRGIYMATSTGSSGSIYGEIVNNMIGGGFRATTVYGIYTTSSRWRYYHNTIFVDNPGTGASRAYMQTAAGGTNELLNNLFVIGSSSNSTAIPVEISTISFVNILDYNNYVNLSGTTLLNIASTIYDKTNFKAPWSSGGGANAFNDVPTFVSASDPHLASTYDAPSGDVTLGITLDVDGDVRCPGTATIGADHTNFPQLVPTSVFVVADSVYLNYQTRIVNTTKGDPSKYSYVWYVDGLYAANTRNLDYLFSATGTYTVSLVVKGCSGQDSSFQSVNVVLSKSLPRSDFVADRQVVDVYQPVNLRDNSKFGPTEWEWNVSPDGTAFYIDNTIQNPSIFFSAYGFYDICLTAKNYNGAGNDTCKSSYIFVKEEYNMCSSATTMSTSRFGKVYDDGGSGGNYATNKSCTYLIDPCASSITLKFSQFALAAGDVVNVYDGSNSSAPLLGSFNSSTTGLPGGSAGLTANSGKMFITWLSDASTVAAGFAAEWTSVADGTPLPTADFTFNDTIYTDEAAVFTSTSIGPNLSYAWDFDPPSGTPGNEGGNKSFDSYNFSTDGTYNVKLRVFNCAGSNYITKAVKVIAPTAPPTIDFVANRTLAPVNGVITFTDKSTQGPLTFEWKITPSTGVNILPNKNSRNITATFIVPGTYSVQLMATNSFGADSLLKTSYIKIYDYCDPGVASLDGKIGISNVTFAGINNTTPAGTTAFSNYINTPPFAQVLKRGTYPISISRINTTDLMNRKVWIDWNIDGDFDDTLEMVASEGPARTTVFNGSITVPNFAVKGITRMRVGVSYGNNTNKPCGLNPVGEFEDYSVQVGDDEIAPVITLNGPATMNVEQWYQYVDPGFTAIDNVDGNITTRVSVTSNVDSTIVGTYLVKYEVMDVAGNKSATVIRTVKVTPDVTAPEITLIGASPMKHTVKTPFSDPGATATDYFNRNFTSAIIVTTNNVDTAKTGSYMITYEVTDLAGNKKSVTRTVEMVDDIAPVITKVGDTVYVNVKNPYIEPGVSATDNYDSAVNVISSTVPTNATGTFILTYTATDKAGNTTTLSRTIVVRDIEKPVIKLNGLDTVILDVFSIFVDPGTKVTDNYCNGLVAEPSTVVNTNKLGTTSINYDVTDCEGNVAVTVTRVVKIVDRVAPMLQLKGFTHVHMMRWQPYADSGVVYTDNYYSVAELTPNLKVTSNVNPLWEGNYEYCYDLMDPSGNVAQRVCRMVEVTANTTGVGEFMLENLVNVFPNPTNGKLNVDVKFIQHTDLKITVMNLLGETLAQTTEQSVLENSYAIDLGQYAAGMYLVRIEADGQAVTKKITLVR